MIVWLNGAFGVGKTSTARRLAALTPDSRVYDPEPLGSLLQHTIGRLQRGDFQHLVSWRRGTVLRTRMAAHGHGVVIVPMTVLRPDYLDEMLAALRTAGHDVRHVTLDATSPVLHARIAADEAEPQAAEWRRHHIDIYADVREELRTRGRMVDTTAHPPADVAAAIADQVLAAR